MLVQFSRHVVDVVQVQCPDHGSELIHWEDRRQVDGFRIELLEELLE